MAEVKRPKCEACGTSSNVHAVSREGMIPGAALAYQWLCGDYEYRRTHPDAARIDPPLRKPKVPQVETLLSGEGMET